MTVSTQRFDFGRLSKSSVQRTPSGGVRVPAAVTRTGVLNYTNPDGSIRRELRPPEEVFKQDSLDTLRDAPVVERHPAMIDPGNWEKYAIGHVSGAGKQDGIFVVSDIAIQKSEPIGKIDSGELCEISCGYTCDEDRTPGVYDGQPYDLIQRNIRYNHVGLGPANWGRAGNQVGLRLDSAVCVFDSTGETPLKQGGNPEVKTMKIRFDGKEYEAGSDDHILAMTRKLDALEAVIEEKDKELAESKAGCEKKDAQLDEAKTQRVELQKKLDEANDQKRLDALVAERVALVVSAKPILGDEYKFDGADNIKVMSDAILKVRPEKKLDGKSADYIAAAFDAIVESGVRADGIDAVPAVLSAVAKKLDDKDPIVKVDQNEPRWDAVKE